MPERRSAQGLHRFTLAGFLLLGLTTASVAHSATMSDSRAQRSVVADQASADAKKLVAWVLETDDHQGLPFIIVDKTGARVLAYEADGRLLGSAAALLGIGRGDDSPPGIGARPLSGIRPEERVTPAGRFVASAGVNLSGKSILWIDYASALSLHPVVTAKASDRRLERLASATTVDNRISYGCINVPAAFYKDVVRPLFGAATGIVYILPETRSLEAVFFSRAPD